MTAITTFTSLKTAVKDYLDRDDIDSQIDRAISLAEARIYRALKTRHNEVVSILSIVNGSVDLPGNFISAKRLKVGDCNLVYLSIYDFDTVSYGNFYTIDEGKVKILTTNSNSDLTITYYRKPTALSLSNESNELLSVYPDIFLYAVLLECVPFIENDSKIAIWKGYYEAALEDARSEEIYSQIDGSLLTTNIEGVV